LGYYGLFLEEILADKACLKPQKAATLPLDLLFGWQPTGQTSCCFQDVMYTETTQNTSLKHLV
jgi:hypothetical protein